jgi:hypothetical protein
MRMRDVFSKDRLVPYRRSQARLFIAPFDFDELAIKPLRTKSTIEVLFSGESTADPSKPRRLHLKLPD